MAVHRAHLDHVALGSQLHLAREVAQKEDLPGLGATNKLGSARSGERREVSRELHVVLERQGAACAELERAPGRLLVGVEATALTILHIRLLHEEVDTMRDAHPLELRRGLALPLRPGAKRYALNHVHEVP